MSTQDDGGPAFPTENEHQTGNTTYHFAGMTLRDYFAAHALAGLLGRSWADPYTGQVPDNVHELWAEGAYATADAMLKARRATEGGAS